MGKKSILAETLQDIKDVREAIEKNANHVLKSTLKEELEDIIKKGISENDDLEDEFGGEPKSDGMDFGSAGGDHSEEMTGEPGIGDVPSDELPGDEVIDLTDKGDDEVLKTFQLMEPTDEIEIIRNEDGIQINFHPEGGEEGIPGETPELPAAGGDEGGAETEDGEDEGMMYEIEIEEDEVPGNDADPKDQPGSVTETDDEDDDTVTEVDGENDDDEPVEEASTNIKALNHTTMGGQEELNERLKTTRKKLQSVVNENKKIKTELENLKALSNDFKLNEGEYKKAIKALKNQLQEVALYTSNLTYAVKLMTENTTTKDEKYEIITALDKAKTVNDSQTIFTSLNEQYSKKKTTTASKIIEEKVLDKPRSSGASINESTAYQNPQIERMKQLIGRIN